MVAKLAEVDDISDPEIDTFIQFTISTLNRSGYKFIGAVHDHYTKCQGPQGGEQLAVVIILAEGHSESKLREKELGPIDETIRSAQPYVLVGPDVWELWG